MARMKHLHICPGIVRLTYIGHSNSAVFLVSFLQLIHREQYLADNKASQTVPGIGSALGRLIMSRHAIG